MESKGKITIGINKTKSSFNRWGVHFHKESGLLINWHAETATKTAHGLIKAYGNIPKILTSIETACTSQIRIS